MIQIKLGKTISDCNIFLDGKDITSEFLLKSIEFNARGDVPGRTRVVLEVYIDQLTIDLDKFILKEA